MSNQWKIIHSAIKRIDPTEEIVSINLTSKKINYSEKIVKHRNVESVTEEELVRAYLIVRLVKQLKYNLDDIELEKPYTIGRPKESKARLDILVKDKRNGKNDSFLIIEVKAPEKYDKDGRYTKETFIEGQLFSIAKQEEGVSYLIYYTAETLEAEIIEKNIIIDFVEYPAYESWENSGYLSLDKIPKEYGIARKNLYVNKTKEDLKEDEKNLVINYSKKEFKSLRKDLHDVLWGGGGNYNYIFSNLIKLFLAKIYDEETTPEGKEYTFQIGIKDNELETPAEVYEKINGLLKRAQIDYLNYPKDKVINSTGIDKEQISESKVAYVVEKLQGISITKNSHDGDVLGDFFEEIVNEGFKQNKGQFFTHTNIVKFVLLGLNVDKLSLELLNDSIKPRFPYFCDPSCGSGTFLIEAMKLVTKTVKENDDKIIKTKRIQDFISSNIIPFKENIWAREFIYGIEKDTDLGLTTKVNMILHGDGNINVFINDGHKSFESYESKSSYGNILKIRNKSQDSQYAFDVNEMFDVVVSNPPFSIKLDTDTQKGLDKRFKFADKKNSENLFVERWYQLLKPMGRLGVILPDSIFDTKENMYIRLFIYKYFKIVSVVSLPDLAFKPFTPTKTSILFAVKKNSDEVQQWEDTWREKSNEFGKISRIIQNIIKKPKDFDEETKMESLRKFLKNLIHEEDSELDSQTLLEKYKDEIKSIDKTPEWWIFGEVSKEHDYSIFMAEADEIGYKRTKRGEKERPNDLFSLDDHKRILLDEKDSEKILYKLRNFAWSE